MILSLYFISSRKKWSKRKTISKNEEYLKEFDGDAMHQAESLEARLEPTDDYNISLTLAIAAIRIISSSC